MYAVVFTNMNNTWQQFLRLGKIVVGVFPMDCYFDRSAGKDHFSRFPLRQLLIFQ